MKNLMFVLLFGVVLFNSCTRDTAVLDQDLKSALNQKSWTGNTDYYILPESDDYATIPGQDPKNPITDAKVNLGKLLFFETGIGVLPKKQMSMETYSCSSCHIVEKSFTAGRFQGIADGAVGFGNLGDGRTINPSYDGTEVDAQGARPLPVINLAYVRNALWNGSFGSFGMNVGTENIWGVADTLTRINQQQREGLEAVIPRAFIVHRQNITKEIVEELGYKGLFDKAFPNVPESERYTLRTAGDAIAAYFRTVLTNRAPFQRWLKGDDSAMTDDQKEGALLFFGKAGCVNCHNSPSLNGQRFAALGVKDLDQMNYVVYKTNDGRSNGRASFTLDDNDLYKFKVPQLYNLKDVGFYFHGASKTSLKDVVRYFNEGVHENSKIPASKVDPLFHPLDLTDKEIDQLTEFLENGLYDPELRRYEPGFILSGNCFPNNDNQSRLDMGCNK